MADSTRALFALSQEELASWLGVSRSAVAAAEAGLRSMPLNDLRAIRLDLAALGLSLQADGSSSPVPPPLALPPPDADPLERQLATCRHQIHNLKYELGELRHQAAPYEARLRAVPILRGWTGPVKNPEREARWINHFELIAVGKLQEVCGRGPQRLLEARIAGLEREVELLEEILTEQPPPA